MKKVAGDRLNSEDLLFAVILDNLMGCGDVALNIGKSERGGTEGVDACQRTAERRGSSATDALKTAARHKASADRCFGAA